MSDLAKRGGELVALLERMRPAIAQALPKHISADRIARIALTAVRANPALALCTQQSFLGSLLQASQLGLEVNTPLGHAYLIPYKDVCTLVIGYQGMLDLARRSGMVKAIYAHPVFEGDTFDYELGLEPKLKHKPTEKPGALTHVYAVARLTDGEPIFKVLSRDDVETYRARSRAKDNGPWVTDYTAMSLKTAVRRLFTWLPKSAEQSTALTVDETEHEQGSAAQAFSPEVMGILDTLPAEPAPSPVPAGTPDGRRVGVVKLPNKRGAAHAPRGASGGEPPPAGATGAAAPVAGPATPAAPPSAVQAEINRHAAESTAAKAAGKLDDSGRPKPPSSTAPWATPPPPETFDPAALLSALTRVDDAWRHAPDGAAIVATWSQAERLEAWTWAQSILTDRPLAEQMRRPPFTNIDAPPEGDE